MNYKIYIISLKKELSQAELLAKVLRKIDCGQEIIHIEAVDGRALTAKEYFSYIKNAYKLKGLLISPGMMGATLSHLSVLNRIVEKKETALILEYDAILLGEFHELMVQLSLTDSPSVIQMCPGERFIDIYSSVKNIKYNENFKLYSVTPLYGMWYTAAYAVNWAGAKEIIKSHAPGPFIPDNWCEMINPKLCHFYFKRIFEHPVEPNIKMENERIASDGDAVASVLKNHEAELIKRVSLKKLIINRLASKIKKF